MAREKDKINLDAVLRVRKTSLVDFLAARKGDSVESKANEIFVNFQLSDETKKIILDFVAAEKSEKDEVKAIEDAKVEETKRSGRRRRGAEEPETAEVAEEVKEEVEEKASEEA